MAEWYFILYMYHTSFIHFSTNGHLDSFNILAIINNAAYLGHGVLNAD